MVRRRERQGAQSVRVFVVGMCCWLRFLKLVFALVAVAVVVVAAAAAVVAAVFVVAPMTGSALSMCTLLPLGWQRENSWKNLDHE